MKILLSLFCIFYLSTAGAQWYDPEKVNSKVQFIYTGAIDQLRDGQFEAGKKLLRSALKIDPRFVDGYLSLGGACGQLKQYDSAIYFYQK